MLDTGPVDNHHRPSAQQGMWRAQVQLKRFQFMLDRQYPATPLALSGHWRYPCFNENWKRSRAPSVAGLTKI